MMLFKVLLKLRLYTKKIRKIFICNVMLGLKINMNFFKFINPHLQRGDK